MLVLWLVTAAHVSVLCTVPKLRKTYLVSQYWLCRREHPKGSGNIEAVIKPPIGKCPVGQWHSCREGKSGGCSCNVIAEPTMWNWFSISLGNLGWHKHGWGWFSREVSMDGGNASVYCMAGINDLRPLLPFPPPTSPVVFTKEPRRQDAGMCGTG